MVVILEVYTLLYLCVLGFDSTTSPVGSNVILFVTPFDPWSADEIEGAINPPVYKISSGDLVNIPLIDHVNTFGKPLIISTGGGTLEDIDRVVENIIGFS